MRAATHTPGPWSLDHGQDVERGHVGISSKHHSLLAQVVWRFEDDERTPHCEANAQLISAAPELLDALDEILRCRDAFEQGGEYPTSVDAWLKKARAAVAKAKGSAA